MTGTPGHFCPGCGRPLDAVLRYPWHFCPSCCDSAVDGAGRRLEFGNESLSGGFMFRYAGDGDDGWISCRGVVALIVGRPVSIGEARFGGIVAEPLTQSSTAGRGVYDLRRGDRVAKPVSDPAGRGRRDPFSG